ncbi:hypothetical protein DL98DRAFT_508360 [Cadophora sp. DSE1049]|nr:hypothetical protein DL98DRAFT_508360 [Cadophora sp. DSE1049]
MSTRKLPNIALLGSTGRTGQEVLRVLLRQDVYHLKIYARAKDRLLALFPQIKSNPRIEFYIGNVTDDKVIQECLDGAQIIISTLGGEGWFPDTVLRDSALSIVTALKALRQRSKDWQAPRLIYLSSATRNERFAAARPRLVHWMIETAFYNGYEDLRIAERTILADPSLVSVLRVQPTVLAEDRPTGYNLSTETVSLGISYEDLGAAFVELALEREFDELVVVGVSGKLDGLAALRYAPLIVRSLFGGFFCRFVPGARTIRSAFERALAWIC